MADEEKEGRSRLLRLRGTQKKLESTTEESSGIDHFRRNSYETSPNKNIRGKYSKAEIVGNLLVNELVLNSL